MVTLRLRVVRDNRAALFLFGEMKMKRILLALFLCVVIAVSAYGSAFHIRKTQDAVTVAASGTNTSTAVDFGAIDRKWQPDGYFSIQVVLTGDGTAKFEYLISNDGTNFIEPSSASDIATGHTKTSGPGSDGIDIYEFSPEPCRYMKIRVTETGTSNSVVATVTLMFN